MFAARACTVPGKGQHVCRTATLAARNACIDMATALSGCAAAAVAGGASHTHDIDSQALCLSRLAKSWLCAQL